MTMRTVRYFACPKGHQGVEKTSENDQPYSASWESVEVTGMREHGKDGRGYASYTCSICFLNMVEAKTT